MILELTVKDGPRRANGGTDIEGVSRREPSRDSHAARLWFLTVTLEIHAPVSWWTQTMEYFADVLWVRARPDDESDTVRVLGTENFEEPIPEKVLEHLNHLIASGARTSLQTELPASFLRRGLVHTNLAVLHEILSERGHYNEGHWAAFCTAIRKEPSLHRELTATGQENHHDHNFVHRPTPGGNTKQSEV